MWFTIFLHCKCCNSNTARNSPFRMCCGLSMDKRTQVEIKKCGKIGNVLILSQRTFVCFQYSRLRKRVNREYLTRTQWEAEKQVYSLKWDTKSPRIKCQLPPHGWNSHYIFAVSRNEGYSWYARHKVHTWIIPPSAQFKWVCRKGHVREGLMIHLTFLEAASMDTVERHWSAVDQLLSVLCHFGLENNLYHRQ